MSCNLITSSYTLVSFFPESWFVRVFVLKVIEVKIQHNRNVIQDEKNQMSHL